MAAPRSTTKCAVCRIASIPNGIGDREDITDIPLVTIDGEDARDFDDAVFCQPRPKGGWRLVVAIADVGSYVRSVRRSTSKRASAATRSICPIASCRCCRKRCRTGCVRCGRRNIGCAWCATCRCRRSARSPAIASIAALMFSRARLTYTQVAAFIDAGYQGFDAEVADSLRALHHVVQGAARGARRTRRARFRCAANRS